MVAVKVVTQREDSDRGRWAYSRWSPARLAEFVEIFWHSEGTTSPARERILPNGFVELALTLGDRHRYVAGERTELLPVVGLSGMRSSPLVIEHPVRHDVLAVRLRPAGAYALLGMPMHEVNEAQVDLGEVLGRAADELAERCHAAPSVEERFLVLSDWLARRIGRSRGLDEAIAWSASRIERSDGGVSIAELREEVGMSKARLVAAFREQIGVAPKLYARIVRFRRACAMLDAGAGPLADAALAAGYYDQAHMNVEFRELAGITPREFLAHRYPGGNTTVEPGTVPIRTPPDKRLEGASTLVL
jgi:AraC-like DNA-binding protein